VGEMMRRRGPELRRPKTAVPSKVGSYRLHFIQCMIWDRLLRQRIVSSFLALSVSPRSQFRAGLGRRRRLE